jgi:LmbE family N-acetylglucosaminyl deacetylase
MADVKRMVVVAPHPDDDVLGCGGTIACKVQEGWQVFIIYVTTGGNSHARVLGILNAPTPAQLAEIRKAEAISAAQVLGVPAQNLIFLGLNSDFLRKHPNEAGARLANVLSATRPDMLFYPMVLDTHPTHKSTGLIVESLKNIDPEPIRLRYWIWRESEPSETGYKTVRYSIKSVLRLKEQALQQHKSQISLFYKSQTRPVLNAQFVQGFLRDYEEFWVDAPP